MKVPGSTSSDGAQDHLPYGSAQHYCDDCTAERTECTGQGHLWKRRGCDFPGFPNANTNGNGACSCTSIGMAST
eukprot:m.119108 g.119108  ORF g.119108 m.119108 type:complete len:74 (-) comp17233_c0_seq6:4436-4657(-)